MDRIPLAIIISSSSSIEHASFKMTRGAPGKAQDHVWRYLVLDNAYTMMGLFDELVEIIGVTVVVVD